MFVDKEQDYIDNIVFVILKRTMKELRVKPHLPNRLYNTLKGAVKLCSDSRKTHPSENYYENIAYWPGDMGADGGRNKRFIILFFARIISNIMSTDKTKRVNNSSMKLVNIFNEKLCNMLSRVLQHGDYDDDIGFLIKYGEELGYAILACQDIGKKFTWGDTYVPSSYSLFFNSFYPKHIKELSINTFLI
jgi:hypothetical protein